MDTGNGKVSLRATEETESSSSQGNFQETSFLPQAASGTQVQALTLHAPNYVLTACSKETMWIFRDWTAQA